MPTLYGASIKDVAKAAGVGVATVSRVINGSGYVKLATRERILAAMEELNFHPSSLARGLVRGSTATLGLLVPDVANPFFSEIARGAEDAARDKRFSVFLCNSDWQPEREANYLKLLQSHRVAGVVIVGSRSRQVDLLAAIGELPFVLVDRQNWKGSAASVSMNNEVGAMMAVDHLLAQGCTNVVHIAGPKGSPSAQARLAGYSKAMEAAGRAKHVVKGDFRYQSGYDAALQLFLQTVPPDGIFAGNDMMAVGVLQAMMKLGVKVPEDVRVIGFDNIALSAYVAPSLSTIKQPAYEMGKLAFRMLLQQLSEEGESSLLPEQFEFSPELVIRASTS